MSRSRPPKCRLGRNCGVCCYTAAWGKRRAIERLNARVDRDEFHSWDVHCQTWEYAEILAEERLFTDLAFGDYERKRVADVTGGTVVYWSVD